MIKHVSFDLWGTLITHDPQFKIERAKIFAQELNEFYPGCNVSADQCTQGTKEVSKSFDRMVDLWGISLIPIQLIHMSVCRITGITNPDLIFLLRLESLFNGLFLDHLPKFIDKNVPLVLNELHCRNISMNISSNTGFLSGYIIRRVLQEIGLLYFFKFCAFSDEIEYSKPNLKFWESVIPLINVPNNEIIHIGDKESTDNSSIAGIKYGLINSTDKTIEDVLTILENE